MQEGITQCKVDLGTPLTGLARNNRKQTFKIHLKIGFECFYLVGSECHSIKNNLEFDTAQRTSDLSRQGFWKDVYKKISDDQMKCHNIKFMPILGFIYTKTLLGCSLFRRFNNFTLIKIKNNIFFYKICSLFVICYRCCWWWDSARPRSAKSRSQCIS